MNKTEATNVGTEAGIAYADIRSDNELRQDLDAHRADIKERATFEALNNMGFRSIDSPNAKAFVEAFIYAANTRFLGRRNDLPDVKEARKVEWVDRKLRQGLDDAKATLAKFRANFDENPAYAFEWGTDAITAAATLDVYTRLVEVFAKTDVATTIKEAKEAVLRGARYDVLPRSTSPTSNLMNAAKVAAFAGFVSDVAFIETL
jgi:hypothetical protein